MAQTKDTLIYVGKQHGMSEQDVETCEKDQALFDKLAADQQYAVRGVEGHLDADLLSQWRTAQGSMSFEELEERIKPLLKK